MSNQTSAKQINAQTQRNRTKRWLKEQTDICCQAAKGSVSNNGNNAKDKVE